jgi:hypothetical protein
MSGLINAIALGANLMIGAGILAVPGPPRLSSRRPCRHARE